VSSSEEGSEFDRDWCTLTDSDIVGSSLMPMARTTPYKSDLSMTGISLLSA
jgi:hypothetical protein